MGLCNPTPVGESRNTFPEAGSTPLPLTLLPCCCHGGMVDGEGGGGGHGGNVAGTQLSRSAERTARASGADRPSVQSHEVVACSNQICV